MKRILNNPHAAVVVGSLLLVVVLAVIFGTIGGSYVLMVHYVNHLTQQQQAAQKQGGMGLCRAVLQMDLASHGATFPASSGGSSYGHKLAAAIHELYVSSGCPKLLG